MARGKRCVNESDTIWECPCDLWNQMVVPVIQALDPPKAAGRKRIDLRRALNGIICQIRTGCCQWNHLPWQFRDDSAVQPTRTMTT